MKSSWTRIPIFSLLSECSGRWLAAAINPGQAPPVTSRSPQPSPDTTTLTYTCNYNYCNYNYNYSSLNPLHKQTCGSSRLQKTMKLWCLVSCDHCESYKFIISTVPKQTQRCGGSKAQKTMKLWC